MKYEDKTMFVTLMTGIAELYGKKLSTHWLEIYWRCLESYEFNDIKNALNSYIVNPDNGQFIPKPADIVRILIGNSTEKALYAWSKVLKAIREVGCYTTIVFDDPIIHVVIYDMGGWITLCRTVEDQLPFIGREFEKRFMGYLRQKLGTYPTKLIGFVEHFNQQNSDTVVQPVLFGNKTLALQVYRGEYLHLKPASKLQPNLFMSEDKDNRLV